MAKTTKNVGRRKRGQRGMGRLFKKQGTKQFSADSPAAGTYYLTYTVEGKRKTEALRDSRGNPVTDRKAAETARRRILAPFKAGEKVDTLKAIRAALGDAEAEHTQAIEDANPPLQIANAWQAYTTSQKRPGRSGKQTLGQYEGHWTRFTAWLAEAHPGLEHLREVTPSIAEQYAGDLDTAGLSPNRFNKHIRFLSLLCRVLAKPARMQEDPFSKEQISRRELTTHSRRELTIPELTTILDKAEGDLSMLLYLGASTGLRLGDCATLRWDEVDLAGRIIRRIPNKTAKSGKPVLLGIPPALHERLSAVEARTDYIIPNMAAQYQGDVAKVTNLVKAHFLNCGIDVHASGTGQRISRNSDGSPKREKDSDRIILKNTGKPAIVEVGFHSLRHTWVSMHAAAGTPGAIIQASVGHANPAMTAHYTHVQEDTARDVALALPVFAASSDSTPPRDPLPEWARELIKSLNGKTWKTVKAELLAT